MLKRTFAIILTLAILGIVMLPTAAMLILSLQAPDAWGAALLDERQTGLLWRSVTVSGVAALLAATMGLPVGYAMARLPRPLALTIALLCPVPLLIPSIVNAIGWMGILKRSGGATQALQNMISTAPAGSLISGEFGTSLLLALCYYPCVALIAAAAFRSVDAGQRNAALLVAGPVRGFLGITARQIAGPLIAGIVLTFLLTFGDFGVASVVGVNVYPIEIFTSFNAWHDFAAAVVRSLPPVLIVIAVMIPLIVITRRTITHTIHGRWRPVGRRPCDFRSILLFVAAFAIAGGASIPPLVHLAAACGSFDNVRRAMETAAPQVIASFETALPAALILLLTGFLLAVAFRRIPAALRWIALTLLAATVVIPGAVTGMGILLLNRDGLISDALYRSGWTIIYADVVRTLALPALLLWFAVAAVARDLDRPALLAGAGPFRRWRRILVPLCAPAFVAAFLIALAFSLGELGASVLVSPAGMMTLPARICSLLHFGEESIVAALCLMVCALVLIPALLIALIAGPPREAAV